MIIFLVTLILTCLFYLIYLLVIRNNVEDLKSAPNVISGFISERISGLPIDVNLKLYVPIYVITLLILLIAMVVFNVNLIVSAIIIVVAISLPFWLVKLTKRRRIELFEKQLPDAIDLMAGSLQSGNSLMGALAMIAEEYPKPLAEEIGLVVREQKLGVSVDNSLQNLVTRMPYNSVILMVSVIRTSIETGGELSDALKNIAKTLRNIEQAEGKIRALTAQGKMQAWVVGLMPIFLMAVLSKMEPASMSKLWSTTEGYIALTAILIFEILGILFIRKIVNIDV